MIFKPHTRISFAITKLVFAVTLALTLLYSVFVLGYSWVIEDNIFNRLVAQQVNTIKNNYQTTGQVAVSKSNIYQLFQGWAQVPAEIVTTFNHEPNRVEFTLANGKTYHLARFDLNNQEYVLLADVEGFEVSRDYLSGIVTWLLGFSLVSCALVAFLGWRMGRAIAKPIEVLADEVSALKTGDSLSMQPLIAQIPDNEVKALAKAIEHSFSQLNEALTRELHFTKDISHEIRTPISVLQNALSQSDVCAKDGEQAQKQSINNVCFSKQAVQQMKSATENLTQTTHVLLALARNESSTIEQVSLNQLIETCVLNHFSLNHTDKGQRLELDINMPNDDVFIRANRNLLEILFNNLLSNVVAYASGREVNCLLTDSSIKLTNSFSEALPEDFLTSGIKAKNSDGIGQGLSLIKRICDACGWQLAVEVTNQTKLFSVSIYFDSSDMT